jgi:LPXTG-motif cell wall-anchored protein
MTVTAGVSPDMAADETVTNTAVLAHDDDPDPTDNTDDDTDTIVDPDPPELARQPSPPPASRPSRPAGFLPRTGAELLNWVWVAAALLGLGGAAWLTDRTRNP